GTFENYVRAKHRIFLNQTLDDWGVLNGQDQAIEDMRRALGIHAKKVYFSSLSGNTITGAAADVYVRDGRLLTTLVTGDQSEIDVMGIDEIPLRGLHNVENVMTALGAVFCAMSTRIDGLPALREAVKQFKGVEHRIEYVTEINGVAFYNDS